jgi:hypothetical protein
MVGASLPGAFGHVRAGRKQPVRIWCGNRNE